MFQCNLICFNATSPNALLPCRNQQLGAPSCHKCPMKWGLCVIFWNTLFAANAVKTSKKAFHMYFRDLWRTERWCLFCLFTGYEIILTLGRMLKMSDSQPLRRILFNSCISVSVVSAIFWGGVILASFILLYIIYWLLISYIDIVWDLKNKHTSKNEL